MQIQEVIILLALILGTLVLSEQLARAGKLSLVLARKLVHLVAVSGVAISPLFFPNQRLLAGIIAFFVLILLWAVATRRFAIDAQRQRRSWGIALFPLAFLILLVPFGTLWPWLVVYPMLVLALADPAAALVGELVARRYWQLTGDRKSWPGSLTFFVVAAAVLLLLPEWLRHVDPLFAWPFVSLMHGPTVVAILVVAALAALAEALGSGGGDNMTVPLVTAWGMAAVGDSALQSELLPAAGLAALFGVLAWWRRWLDAGGAALAALTGVMVWTIGGWSLALPLILFFLSGSLLGRLPRKVLPDAKHGRPRDWMQVLANGGIVIGLMWLHGILPSSAWLLAAWISVSISMADTWSSEFGQWAGGRVVDIVGFRNLRPGLSGGISWQGTLGGLAGAVIIGGFAWGVGGFSPAEAVVIALAGFAGMLADSLLGSLCQARYRRANGEPTEDSSQASSPRPEKGWAWMTNDWVNLLSNLVITILFAALAGTLVAWLTACLS
ncbi:MAG: DUF92 domain-containing protein [Chitinophagaceae bacterium]|nr:DUF92 domain-containing protein [Chitinophagaceae bacterium]